MPGFTKTLNFNYSNLGKEGNLVFVFDDEKIANYMMYTDYFPVIWRVVHLTATGIHRFSETFNQKFLFTTPPAQKGIVTVASAITPINFKESTNLTGDDENGYNWSVPEKLPVAENILEAHNLTATVQAISFCTESSPPHVVPEPLLYIPDVGSLNTLKVEFTGRLRIYHVPHVPTRMLFAGDILYPDYVKKIDITSPPLWDNYIAEPGLKEEWIITFNKQSGNFEIKPGE